MHVCERIKNIRTHTYIKPRTRIYIYASKLCEPASHVLCVRYARKCAWGFNYTHTHTMSQGEAVLPVCVWVRIWAFFAHTQRYCVYPYASPFCWMVAPLLPRPWPCMVARLLTGTLSSIYLLWLCALYLWHTPLSYRSSTEEDLLLWGFHSCGFYQGNLTLSRRIIRLILLPTTL